MVADYGLIHKFSPENWLVKDNKTIPDENYHSELNNFYLIQRGPPTGTERLFYMA